MPRRDKTIEVESRLVAARTWGDGERGVTANGYRAKGEPLRGSRRENDMITLI